VVLEWQALWAEAGQMVEDKWERAHEHANERGHGFHGHGRGDDRGRGRGHGHARGHENAHVHESAHVVVVLQAKGKKGADHGSLGFGEDSHNQHHNPN
jgi:hypothetical protein